MMVMMTTMMKMTMMMMTMMMMTLEMMHQRVASHCWPPELAPEATKWLCK